MNTYIVDKLFTEVVENCQCRLVVCFRDVVLIFFVSRSFALTT